MYTIGRKITSSLLLVVFLASSIVFAEDERVIEEKSFAAKPGGRFKLEAPGSDVKVNGWDKHEVVVKFYGSSRINEYFDFRFHNENGLILVQVKKKGSYWSRVMDGVDGLTVEVYEPNEFHTNIETAGGDITLTGVDGDAKLNTSGGDIKVFSAAGRFVTSTAGGDIIFDKVQGSVKCNTAGGGVQCKYIDGDVTASSTGGDIEIFSKDGQISASSTGGDIDVTYDGENSGISLSSTGGDITLSLLSDVKANLVISAIGGDIDCNLSTTRVKKSSAFKFEADINGGGSEIKANSTGGDVSIRRK